MKQQKKQVGITVFYSYAREDESLREQLEKRLSMLRRQGLISEWHNRQIAAGTEWAKEIDAHLETASVILLLVSSDFLASDYCYDSEMQRALERHTRGEARVIPVVLRPCKWQQAPFAHLQVLPHDGKSATEWNNLDAAFLDITQGIRKAIEQQIPLPLLSDVQRQSRTRLLKRVRAIWIEGLLELSLHQAARMDLHLREQPDALENPWRFQVQELDGARKGMELFVDQISNQDRLGITIFSNEAQVITPLADLGPMRPDVQKRIDGIYADGGTRLFDTINEQVEALQKDTSKNIRAVVVLTDGQDNVSHLSQDQLTNNISSTGENAGKGIKVFTIAYGSDADIDSLTKIATATGGQEYTGNPQNIREVYQQISEFF
jgi:uncharacterized protein YegL